MKIEELKKKDNVTVTEVKNGCVKVSADKGFILKGGDTYTSEIYCAEDAELQDYEVVAYSDYLRAENKKKYEGKTIEEAKEMLLAEIDTYDKSSAVNGFYLNGMLIPWSKDDQSSPNVDKRMGLRQNIADKVALGEENISIWMKGMSFTMPCAQAEMLMRSIENYAYECFSVTAAHKKAVSELTSIEEVEKYDITAGYPAQLRMEV
ncbi:DUF4376 domain-containing protein [Leyella stercorea]|uniref:DUF4376 domain-containing protein n=1 Tax=Leyella stercorea TaxID=363265 RepID=UPI001F1F31EC|nr:DUF4376 domain-containing protein [Leyella stercorea]MCF2614740.1 DUF4376 domain-containing protein [Leyella stercorea]